jgi:hypothetical protein
VDRVFLLIKTTHEITRTNTKAHLSRIVAVVRAQFWSVLKVTLRDATIDLDICMDLLGNKRLSWSFVRRITDSRRIQSSGLSKQEAFLSNPKQPGHV